HTGSLRDYTPAACGTSFRVGGTTGCGCNKRHANRGRRSASRGRRSRLGPSDTASWTARSSEAFGAWRAEIRGALTRLVDNGFLDSKTDLEAASSEMLAAVQGGLLLSKTERDSRPLRVAL